MRCNGDAVFAEAVAATAGLDGVCGSSVGVLSSSVGVFASSKKRVMERNGAFVLGVGVFVELKCLCVAPEWVCVAMVGVVILAECGVRVVGQGGHEGGVAVVDVVKRCVWGDVGCFSCRLGVLSRAASGVARRKAVCVP